MPPYYCFRTLTHIFQQLMWPTQNEKTELLTQKNRLKRRLFKVFWSECGGSNPGPPAPKLLNKNFSTFFRRFIDTFGLLRTLFTTLASTVSVCSAPVCSQTCGQKPLSEHPRDRGQKAVFYGLLECCGQVIRYPGLPHCTSVGEGKQALYAGIGSAEFASL